MHYDQSFLTFVNLIYENKKIMHKLLTAACMHVYITDVNLHSELCSNTMHHYVFLQVLTLSLHKNIFTAL